MRRIFIFVLLFIFCVLGISAQQLFIRRYSGIGGPGTGVLGVNLHYNTTTQQYMFGMAATDGQSSWDGLGAMDTCGEVLWSRVLVNPAIHFCREILIDNNGYTAFGSGAQLTQLPAAEYTTLVTRYDPNGNPLQQVTTFTNLGSAIDAHFVGAVRLSSGGYLTCGYAARSGNFKDLYGVKLDAALGVNFAFTTGGPDAFWENFWDVETNAGESSYFYTGENISFSTDGNADGHLTKTTPSGAVQWGFNYSGGRYESFRAICRVGANQLLLAGVSEFSFQAGDGELILMKTDTMGNIIWQFRYDVGLWNEGPDDVFLLPNGNYLVSGYTNSYSLGAEYGGFLMEVNTNGAIVWQKLYAIPGANFSIRSVLVEPNLIALIGDVFAGTVANADLIVARLSSQGDVPPGCFITPVSPNFVQLPVGLQRSPASGVVQDVQQLGVVLPTLPFQMDRITLCGVAPEARFDLPDTLCQGACLDIVDSSLNGPVSWNWSSTAGNITQPGLQNQSGICFNTSGDFSVTLVVENCLSADTLTRNIHIKGVGAASIIADSVFNCLPDPEQFQVTPPYDSLVWTINNIPYLTDTLIADVRPPDTVSVIVYTAGCLQTAELVIRPFAVPVSISGDTVLCPGENTILTAENMSNVSWVPPGWVVNPNAMTTATNLSSTGGLLTVDGLDSNGCPASAQVNLSFDLVIADFDLSDDTLPASELLNIINRSSGADAYVWDFGNGSGSNAENPSVVYADSGSYTIRLIALSTLSGCSDTALAIVVVDDCAAGRLYMPNSFTPNLDNLNPEFRVYGAGRCLEAIRLRVFNRWGEEIFTTTNAASGWNGRYHNETVPAGIYAYRLDYRFTGQPDQTQRGFVNVLR